MLNRRTFLQAAAVATAPAVIPFTTKPTLAVDYAKQIGFKGQFYIEPKPKEPTKHQYDSDAAACLNFLRQFDLIGHLKLNLAW